MKTAFILFVLASLSTAHATPWNDDNNPSNIDGHYKYSFKDLPLTGAVDAEHTPWSDNYWESDLGGISLRWNTLTVQQRDPDLVGSRVIDKPSLFSYVPPTLEQLKTMSREDLINLSPAEKYDILMGHYDYPTVYSERSRTNPTMEDWQGICHGWVPASIHVPEPKPVDVANADGVTVPFGSSDLKGLVSYYYGVTAYDYARGWRKVVRKGNRFQQLNQVDSFDPIAWVNIATNAALYNSDGDRVNLDSLNDTAGCSDEGCIENSSISADASSLDLVSQVGDRDAIEDPNAGAFFVVVSNQLGLKHEAFAANLNRSGHPGEVWNQPVSGFATTMDYDHRGPDGSGTVGLTTTLTYVSEIPQTFTPVVGTPGQRNEAMAFSYEVEINAEGNVTGGTWKPGTHPSFLWHHKKLPIKGYFTKLSSMLSKK